MRHQMEDMALDTAVAVQRKDHPRQHRDPHWTLFVALRYTHGGHHTISRAPGMFYPQMTQISGLFLRYARLCCSMGEC